MSPPGQKVFISARALFWLNHLRILCVCAYVSATSSVALGDPGALNPALHSRCPDPESLRHSCPRDTFTLADLQRGDHQIVSSCGARLLQLAATSKQTAQQLGVFIREFGLFTHNGSHGMRPCPRAPVRSLAYATPRTG